MGNEPSAPVKRTCKIVIRSELFGDVTTLASDPDDTWSELCRRTVEGDYLPKLPELLLDACPGRRLRAYRLRYDLGRGTIVRPTWRTGADGVDDGGYGEDAYADVNVSMRPSAAGGAGAAAPAFAPHETILSSLGEEGTRSTTFVDVHCEEIGTNGVGPFPVAEDLTRVLVCEEHEGLPGFLFDYRWEAPGGGNGVLPERCANRSWGDDRGQEMGGTAVASGDRHEGGDDNSSDGENEKREEGRNETDGGAGGSIGEPATTKADGAPADGTATRPADDEDKAKGVREPLGDKKKSTGADLAANVRTDVSPAAREEGGDARSDSGADESRRLAAEPTAEKPGTRTEIEDEGGKKRPRRRVAKKRNDEPDRGEAEDDPARPAPAVKQENGNPARPAGESGGTAPSRHTKGLPAGWTRVDKEHPTPLGKPRKSSVWFSPQMRHRFRSGASAKRFLEALEEAGGDEEKALVLCGMSGTGARAPAAKGESADAADSGGAQEGAATKPMKANSKRKRAKKKQRSASEGEDESKPPAAKGGAQRKKSKSKKENPAGVVDAEDENQANDGKSKEAEAIKSTKEKKSAKDKDRANVEKSAEDAATKPSKANNGRKREKRMPAKKNRRSASEGEDESKPPAARGKAPTKKSESKRETPADGIDAKIEGKSEAKKTADGRADGVESTKEKNSGKAGDRANDGKSGGGDARNTDDGPPGVVEPKKKRRRKTNPAKTKSAIDRK